MPDIAFTLTHTPGVANRERWARRILQAVPPARLITDHGRNGVWPADRQGWLACGHVGATHHCVMQDDMLPCDGFLTILHGAVAAAPPDVPICYFSMRKTITAKARAAGSPWWIGRGSNWGGTTVLPADLTLRFIDWCDHYIDPAYKSADARLKAFLNCRGQDVWMTTASLVEHVGAASSLIGNSNARRVAAWRYIPSRDGPIDWTPPQRIPQNPALTDGQRAFLATISDEARVAANQ